MFHHYIIASYNHLERSLRLINLLLSSTGANIKNETIHIDVSGKIDLGTVLHLTT